MEAKRFLFGLVFFVFAPITLGANGELICDNDLGAGDRVWSVCHADDHELYQVSHRDKNNLDYARFFYTSHDGGSTLEVELSGRYGTLIVERTRHAISISSIFSEADSSYQHSGAVITRGYMSNPYSSDSRLTTSHFWSSNYQTNDYLVESIEDPEMVLGLFTTESSTEGVVKLIEDLLEQAAEDGVLEYIQVPWVSKVYATHNFVSSEVLAFGLLVDAFDNREEIQNFGCVAMAFGAIGAIAGLLRQNPTFGIGCGTSCGVATGCLVGVTTGTALNPFCYGSVGGCLTCLGLGYAYNFSECLRIFFEME